MPVDYVGIWSKVCPCTMLDYARISSLIQLTQQVVETDIPGAIVECGVWKGGAMAAIAMTLLQLGAAPRELWLYDTFSGMTAPDPVDVDLNGAPAVDVYAGSSPDSRGSSWCRSPLEEVRGNMGACGCPGAKMNFVVGDVLATIPDNVPSQIALLHLDTDWYKSTKHELEHLYPLVSKGGYIVVDDYGHWSGSRKAVDEYLAEHSIKTPMVRCGYSEIILMKGSQNA